MAYLKVEDPEAQAILEEAAQDAPGVEVVRRFRWFGERAIRADFRSLEKFLREHRDVVTRRRGRIAILPQTDEEKAELETSDGRFADIWERG